MKKPVSEMTPEEYFELLSDLSDKDLMPQIAHDVKKVVAIAHGYISLLRLDIEEDLLNAEQVQEYMQEMENMFESSYMFLEQAEEFWREKNED